MIWRIWKWFLDLFREEQTEFCQCEHMQCYHVSGKWSCNLSDEFGKRCCCQKFIRPRQGGDGGRGKAPEPSPTDLDRLEKMVR